jgi:DNA-binding GntR family transcriptional regulator
VDLSEPIPRPRLHELIRDQVHDAIASGQFVPGEILAEADLARWLGTSRSTIRTTLVALADLGLVTLRPGKAPRVSSPSPQTLLKGIEVLAPMWALSAPSALGNASEEEVMGYAERVEAARSRWKSDASVTPHELVTEVRVAFEFLLTRGDNGLALEASRTIQTRVAHAARSYVASFDQDGLDRVMSILATAVATRDALQVRLAVDDFITLTQELVTRLEQT